MFQHGVGRNRVLAHEEVVPARIHSGWSCQRCRYCYLWCASARGWDPEAVSRLSGVWHSVLLASGSHVGDSSREALGSTVDTISASVPLDLKVFSLIFYVKMETRILKPLASGSQLFGVCEVVTRSTRNTCLDRGYMFLVNPRLFWTNFLLFLRE